MVVGRVLERLVRDGQFQAVAEDAQLLLVELLGLVGDVAGLHAGAQRPALDGLGQDDRGRAVLLAGRVVGGVELAIVVPTTPEGLDLVVRLVGDEGRQPRIGAEEVLAHVGAGLHGVLLPLTVEDVGHALHEDAIGVARQHAVPLAAPDDLDDVPAGAAEDGLQLLDDLAVAAHGAVETLQVAVDDEDQVVQPLASGDGERAQRLRLVRLAVAEEGPDTVVRGVLDAAVVEVAVEARLVDGRQRREAHGDRGELPEVGHEARVGVRGEALAGHDLAPEVVELRFAEATFEEGAGIDARCRMPLVVDLVAHALGILAAEEVVEADLVEAGRGGEGGQVPADARRGHVGAQDHGRGVPAHHAPDAQLHLLVAGEGGLLLRADGVDVARLGQRRQADVELAGPLEQLVEDELGALRTDLLGQRVERGDPVARLVGVGVRGQELEVTVGVEHHEGIVGQAGARRAR